MNYLPWGNFPEEGILGQDILKSEKAHHGNVITLAKLRTKLLGQEDRKSN
jgi:hypothetical protein